MAEPTIGKVLAVIWIISTFVGTNEFRETFGARRMELKIRVIEEARLK